MDQFAVLHITKYKKNLGGIGAHIDRHHIPKNANPDKIGFNEPIDDCTAITLKDILGETIDTAKTSLAKNENIKSELSLEKAVWQRIKEGHTVKTTIRKDAVLALGVILTGSHETMLEIQENENLFNDWKKANYDFACQKFGKENIVRFVLHLDEKTPHLHCVVVPINEQGRLSARSFVNGSQILRDYQDQYALAMSRFGLGRGIPKALSHRVHVSTKKYQQAMQEIVHQAETLTKEIKRSNILKLGQVQEKLTEHVVKLGVAWKEQVIKNKSLLTTNHNLIQGKQKLAYQRQLEESSKQAYDYVKKAIPIIPFLTEKLGWEIDKNKSTKKDAVLSHHRHGKIIIPTSPKVSTGHWVYSSVNGGGGTLVDLLLADKWSLEQIKGLADGKISYTIDYASKHDIPRITHKNVELDPVLQTKQAQSHLDTLVAADGEGFLHKRGIEQKTYSNLEGLKVSKQAAAFALYKDFDRHGKGNLCGTITYYEDRLGNHAKYFQKDLPRGLCILQEANKNIKNVTNLVITESPVDALSYRQMALEEQVGWKITKKHSAQTNALDVHQTAFISTCGNLSQQIKRDLEQLFYVAHQNNQTVILALDNDIAGKNMTETLSHMLEEAQCAYRIEVPKQGKDWNNILVLGPQAAAEAQDQTIDKAIAEKQWQVFEASSYDASLLRHVGVDESTAEAFKNSIKSNSHSVLVALRKKEDAIDATWSLNLTANKLLKTYVDLDATPSVAILKGDAAKATKIVITPSPIEALLHYQSQVQATKSAASDLGKPSKNEAIDQLDSICYVYIEPKSKQNNLADSLHKLFASASKNQTPLTLVCTQGNHRLAEILEDNLTKYAYNYKTEVLTLPSISQVLTTNLSRSMGLLGLLTGISHKTDEEEQDEAKDKKHRKISV